MYFFELDSRVKKMFWNIHTNHISFKISKAISILYRLKTTYPHLVSQTLYSTLIFPCVNYYILARGSTISEGNPLPVLHFFFIILLNCMFFSLKSLCVCVLIFVYL